MDAKGDTSNVSRAGSTEVGCESTSKSASGKVTRTACALLALTCSVACESQDGSAVASHGSPSSSRASSVKLGLRLLSSVPPSGNSNATSLPLPETQLGLPLTATFKPESGQMRPRAKACGVACRSTCSGTTNSRRASAAPASICCAEAIGAPAHGGNPKFVEPTAHNETAYEKLGAPLGATTKNRNEACSPGGG